MKKILTILILLSTVSCVKFNFLKRFSLLNLSEPKREEKIEKLYTELDKKYFSMLEDVINENERKKLELEFSALNSEILKAKSSKISKEHREYLDKYFKDTSLKLQYLKDLE
ncbi:MAG: hypothetical protein IJG31_04845 [Fusobacterium sp.]|nr:hypothetical protein [Fusobacterium sp.]